MKWKIALAATAVLLAGCVSDSASYLIEGRDHSLTLLREQAYFWSGEWDLELMTTHQPECMRRHKLKPVPMGDFKAELFRSLEGGYILKQGGNWYIADTQKCRLQQYQAPPIEPGDLLGAFEVKDDRLQFVEAAKLAAKPVAPVAPAAPVTPAVR